MSGRTGPTFLLVEHRARTRRRLARVLEGRGLSVVALADLRTAREATSERHFDAWVLGRGAPDEPQDEALALIESRRLEGHAVPTLVVSAAQDRRRASRCHQLGASCIYEPLTNDTLDLFAARAAVDTDQAEVERLVGALAVERSLTQRESALALLVARGVPRSALARELATQESSAKALVRSLLAKTGHASVEAFARALLEARLHRAASMPVRVDRRSTPSVER